MSRWPLLAGVLILVGVAALVATIRSTRLRPDRIGDGDGTRPDRTGSEPTPPAFTGRPVLLFFADPSGAGLVAIRGEVPSDPDPAREAAAAIAAVAAGPAAAPDAPIATVPPETAVRSLFFDGRGTAVIDLGGVAGLREGLDHELLAVWSVVNTLAFNFPAQARRVRVLIDGQEVETLRGHVLLTEPLSPRRDLVRGELPSLAASATPAPETGPE